MSPISRRDSRVLNEILLVPSEDFVRSLAVQQDRHAVPACEPEHAPLGVLAGTAYRQLVVPDEVGQFVEEAIYRRIDRVGGRIRSGDHLRRIGPLVRSCFWEPAREGVIRRVPADQLPGDGHDGAGVEAPGKTGADHHIAAHAKSHRIDEELTEFLEHGRFVPDRSADARIDLPVTPCPMFEGPEVHLHRLSGLKLLDIVEHRLAVPVEPRARIVGGPNQPFLVVIE